MTNKYSHLTVEQLQENLENAKRLVAEQESEIAECVKEMGKKKNTLSDIKRINNNITWHFNTKADYEEWVAEYEEALKRAEKVEAGHEAIVEFLETIYKNDIAWFDQLKADFSEKGYEHYVQLVRSGEITKTILQFAKMAKSEAIKIFKQDIETRYKKLVATVEKKVGKVLKIEVKRNYNEGFDGAVTGENGNCLLTTVLAGGYNIQRLHYRTICK